MLSKYEVSHFHFYFNISIPDDSYGKCNIHLFNFGMLGFPKILLSFTNIFEYLISIFTLYNLIFNVGTCDQTSNLTLEFRSIHVFHWGTSMEAPETSRHKHQSFKGETRNNDTQHKKVISLVTGKKCYA